MAAHRFGGDIGHPAPDIELGVRPTVGNDLGGEHDLCEEKKTTDAQRTEIKEGRFFYTFLLTANKTRRAHEKNVLQEVFRKPYLRTWLEKSAGFIFSKIAKRRNRGEGRPAGGWIIRHAGMTFNEKHDIRKFAYHNAGPSFSSYFSGELISFASAEKLLVKTGKKGRQDSVVSIWARGLALLLTVYFFFLAIL